MSLLIRSSLAVVLIGSAWMAEASTLEKVECTITDIDNNFSSYLRPNIGEKIKLDLTKPMINSLFTDKQNHIPLDKLQKLVPSKWSQHLVTYSFEETTPTGYMTIKTLQIGQFSNTDIQGRIQVLERYRHDILFTVHEIKLSCVEIKSCDTNLGGL